MELTREDYLLWRKCWRKTGSFPTMTSARKKSKRIYRLSGLRLYPYWCDWCGRVHLTKSIDAKGLTL